MDCNFTLCKRYLSGNCIKQIGEKCKLEQAKEIIKEFIAICDFGTEEDYNLRCRAEQFLKEE